MHINITSIVAAFMGIVLMFVPAMAYTTQTSVSYTEYAVPIAEITAAPQEREQLVVDPEAWAAAFDAHWTALRGPAFTYTFLEDDGMADYPAFLEGMLGDALYVQLYMSRSSSEYWFIVEMAGDNVPEGEVDSTVEMAVEAVLTGLLAQFDDMSMRERMDIGEQLRRAVLDIRADDASTTSTSFFIGDMYFSFDWYPEYNDLSCYICFEG